MGSCIRICWPNGTVCDKNISDIIMYLFLFIRINPLRCPISFSTYTTQQWSDKQTNNQMEKGKKIDKYKNMHIYINNNYKNNEKQNKNNHNYDQSGH